MDEILSIVFWGGISIVGLSLFCATVVAIAVRTFQFVFRVFGL